MKQQHCVSTALTRCVRRCSRAPECYKRADYEVWKDEAKAHMERKELKPPDEQQIGAFVRAVKGHRFTRRS